MPKDDEKQIIISDASSMEELFPGYYPPNSSERRDAYQQGLVSLDANALLDFYRFSHKARQEFFQVLEHLRPRLFITHQAALEFHRNRLSTVESRIKAAEDKCKEIEQPLKSVIEKIQEFANRYQIEATEREKLVGLVGELSFTLTDAIKKTGTYDLSESEVRAATDDVLKRLNRLLQGRVGKALSDSERKDAVERALRRREARIPPGYAEKKLDPELQVGDYLVWLQLINEASKHQKSVLLVTNDNKEDWILKDSSNRIIGPRPELVLEMQSRANVQLHMVTVVGLLKEAPDYLGTAVSDSTIREAESLPVAQKRNVNAIIDDSAMKQYKSLSEKEQNGLVAALQPIYRALIDGMTVEQAVGSNVATRADSSFSIPWQRGGRAIFRVVDDPAGTYDLVLQVIQINKRSVADPEIGTTSTTES
jgi:PIN like domain